MREVMHRNVQDRVEYMSQVAKTTSMKSTLTDAAKEIADLRRKNGIAIQALSLIASEQRPDGTYNRDREACGVMARETLEMMR